MNKQRSITHDVHDWLHEHHAPGEEIGHTSDIHAAMPWASANQISAALALLRREGAVASDGIRHGTRGFLWTWLAPVERRKWLSSSVGHRKQRASRRRPALPLGETAGKELNLDPYFGGPAPLTARERVSALFDDVLDRLGELDAAVREVTS